MNENKKINLYNDFLRRWTVERIKNLKLEEYTNDNDDSFIYDVEFGTKELGSIKGRNAFIFGIYKRENLSDKESSKNYIYDTEYAWLGKFGTDVKDVFENVKKAVLDVIINAQNSNFTAIDSIPLDSMYKWKIAYLYQNPKDISITPVFTRAALELYARKIGQYQDNLEMSELYSIIKGNEKYQKLEEAMQVADNIWFEYTNFNLGVEKEIIKNDSTISDAKRKNRTSDIELTEYEMKVHVQRRNPHNKLEKSFNEYLQTVLNASNILQDDNYIDFHFELDDKKYICELKPSDNQKEISYAIQGAIGQILRYSYNKGFDIKIIVFHGEPKEDNLKFLEYLKNEHNIYYLYEESKGIFKGNIL